MRTSSSKQYNLPSSKKFVYSYCKQHTYELKNKKRNIVDLSNLINKNTSLLYKGLYYKLNNIGYSIDEVTQFINTDGSLKEILEEICVKGFIDKNKKLLIEMIPTCYLPTENNIINLLSDGNIIFAGIFIDDDFAKNVLNEMFTLDKTLTDIVLITGYDNNSYKILTNWTDEIISVNKEFINNFVELWNVEIIPFN